MSIPDAKLVFSEEFDQRFIEYSRECRTYEQAYLKVEEDFKAVFGKTKYTGYNSFRVSRYKRIKTKRRGSDKK